MSTDRSEAFTQEIREHLHDLSQPLTALQCRLEMGRMQAGDAGLLLEAIQDSLIETARMFATIAIMRQCLHREDDQERSSD